MNPSLQDLAQKQAKFCHLFSNERRVLILWALQAYQELSVGDLARMIDSSLQNTSQHLSVLRKHEIVTSRRDGQTIYYRLNQFQEMKCSLLDPRASVQVSKLFDAERTHASESEKHLVSQNA